MDAALFSDRMNSMLMRYPDEINLSMYNCLGSHDTARFLTEACGQSWRLRLAMAFQMCFPGSPAIYYGDECGMTGENDPGCRAGMVWDCPDWSSISGRKDDLPSKKAHRSATGLIYGSGSRRICVAFRV